MSYVPPRPLQAGFDGRDRNRRAALLDLVIFIQYRHEEIQFRNCAADPSMSFLAFGTTTSGPAACGSLGMSAYYQRGPCRLIAAKCTFVLYAHEVLSLLVLYGNLPNLSLHISDEASGSVLWVRSVSHILLPTP